MGKKAKAPRGIADVTVQIGGRRRRMRFCALGLKRAAALGYGQAEYTPPLKRDDAGRPIRDDNGDFVPDFKSEEESMDFNFRLLLLGLLPFEPDLTQESLEFDLLIEEMEPAFERALEAFRRFMPKTFARREKEKRNGAADDEEDVDVGEIEAPSR